MTDLANGQKTKELDVSGTYETHLGVR